LSPSVCPVLGFFGPFSATIREPSVAASGFKHSRVQLLARSVPTVSRVIASRTRTQHGLTTETARIYSEAAVALRWRNPEGEAEGSAAVWLRFPVCFIPAPAYVFRSVFCAPGFPAVRAVSFAVSLLQLKQSFISIIIIRSRPVSISPCPYSCVYSFSCG
jgi:hypothetical protein